MSDKEEPQLEQYEFEGEDLDNPLRVIIVINSPDHPEGEMEERLLDSIQSFDDVNAFFDSFDESIAIPNTGHIKYEVGSDGLVVVVVDNLELRNKALVFMDDYRSQLKTSETEDTEAASKRSKTN